MYQNITLIGNVGNDPELRNTGTGTPVTAFSLAVNKTWTGTDGEKKEKTVWFRISAWGKLAELTAQYLSKGRQVMVSGEVEEARVYEKDGAHRASLEVTAKEVKFLGSKEGGGSAQAEPAGTGRYPAKPMRRDAPSDEDIPF